MLRCKGEENARYHAESHGADCIGFNIFDGHFYVGSAAELDKAGCDKPIYLNDPPGLADVLDRIANCQFDGAVGSAEQVTAMREVARAAIAKPVESKPAYSVVLGALTELELCVRQYLSGHLVSIPSALLPQCREIIAKAQGGGL